jgi:hypothetical protein
MTKVRDIITYVREIIIYVGLSQYIMACLCIKTKIRINIEKPCQSNILHKLFVSLCDAKG